MTNTTVTNSTTDSIIAASAAPKAPSKKSLALAIFQAKLTERTQGLFASNKEFRAAVLSSIQTDLGVSVASAATMFNSAKKDAELINPTIGLGRDPKVVKEKTGSGQRGRPQGSKNKPKTVEVPVVEAAENLAAEVQAEAATAA